MALLAFPSDAHARYLIVIQLTDRAPNGHVHFPQEVHDLLGRDAKFPCQVIHAQLAQPILRSQLMSR
jgi:hypothetical protein